MIDTVLQTQLLKFSIVTRINMDLFAFISNSRTPEQKLEDAVCKNNLNDLDKLLLEGIDPNTRLQKHGGNTAVHFAAYYGHYRCIERLLAAGANGDQPNDVGTTPLLNAVRSKHPKAMQVLLKMTKSAFDFDRVWACERWTDILHANSDDLVLSTLILATPDIDKLRENLKANLVTQCIAKMFFKSLKLLLLTGNFKDNTEVKHFLAEDDDHEECEDKRELKNWYSQLCYSKTPQTLQHICRLTIRKCFHGNCNVYYGVNQLTLPAALKNTVLCIYVT